MKKTISFIIISLFAFHFTASAQNLYIGSFYVTTQEEESLYGDGNNKWANRLPIISEMFKFEQPDVLGLQSLTASQLSQITQRITTHRRSKNILYAKEMELLSSGDVEELPEGNTCSWVKLQKGEKAFYVFNICFTTDQTVASSAANLVRTAAGEINTEGLPCFIVGYLGVNETKTAYSRLNNKYPDCYTQASYKSGEFGTVNNFDLEANHGTNRNDFIFASKGVTVKAYGILNYGYYTSESDGSHKRRLPSTHFPVMAKVTLP